MRIALLILIFSLPNIVRAHEVNTLFAISNALLVTDWVTTHELVIHNDYHEKNFILGQHPSEADVDRYFASALFVNYLLYRFLPHNEARVYLITVNIVESVSVGANTYWAAKLRLSF